MKKQTKVSLGVRFKILVTGKLPKPKRKAKKRVPIDASKGRHRIVVPKTSTTRIIGDNETTTLHS